MLNEWLHKTEFAYPYLLGFLLLLPVLVFEYLRNHKKKNAAMMVTTTHFIQKVRSIKTSLLHVPFILRCLAIACLIVAMARPQLVNTQEQIEGEGIDMVLCFDISGSMTEKDFKPNRLEAAKAVAVKFVSQRPGDRIGVVIFSSLSFTLCPVTIDHSTVINQINNIESGYLQEEGTAIGSGIATSVDRLRSSKSKTKIIVLLTDGVDVGGAVPPGIATQMAKEYGIKIYAIGVGSENEIEEVVKSSLGSITQKRKLEYNENLLKQLAVATGGQYFQALNTDALQKIYDSISQLEKSKIKVNSYKQYTDAFFPWLLTAFCLLIAEVTLRYTYFKKFP